MSEDNLSRRKLLKLTGTAGVTSAVGFSGPALAQETQQTDQPDDAPNIVHDIEVRNAREEAVTTIVQFYKLNKELERISDEPVQTRAFPLKERGKADAAILSSLNLDVGPYEVVAELKRTGETASSLWGVPPGGVPDYSALTVRTRCPCAGMVVGETEI
jgi:hypothetical protein